MRSGHGSEARPLTCAQPVMPGLDLEPAALARGVVVDLVLDRRPRADDRHLAAQDVDQVRQLVEREAAQQAADAGDARIALEHVDAGAHRRRAGDHRAQLPELEGRAAATDAALAVEDRSAALQLDRERRQCEQRRGRARAPPRQARRRGRGSRRTVPARRMRILYLHQFFITRAGVGGTRSYELARRFVARGHRVRMVTAGSGRQHVDGIEVVGVRGGYADYVRATATSYPRRMLAFARFAASACAAALRGPRPGRGLRDLAAADDGAAGAAGRRCAGARRWCSRCATSGPRRRSRWARCATRCCGAWRGRWRSWSTAAAHASSRSRRASATACSRPGVPPAKVTLVPNAADLELFSPCRRRRAGACAAGDRRRALRRLLLRHDGRGQRPHAGARRRSAAAGRDVRAAGRRQAPRRAGGERARERALPRAGAGQGPGGRARRGVGLLPDDLQGRPDPGDQLAQQALRHLRRRAAGDREHGRLDARAGRAQRGRAVRARRRPRASWRGRSRGCATTRRWRRGWARTRGAGRARVRPRRARGAGARAC